MVSYQYIGILFILLFSLSEVWAAEKKRDTICSEFLARLSGVSRSHPRLVGVMGSQAVRRYYGHADNRPVVDAIRQLKEIDVKGAYSLHGRVSEKDDILVIELTTIGPGPDAPVKPSKPQKGDIWDWLKWGSDWMDPMYRFRTPKGLRPTMVKATAAVMEGVDQRLAANPNLKKVVLRTEGILNRGLAELLITKYGFRERQTILGSRAGYRLEIVLEIHPAILP